MTKAKPLTRKQLASALGKLGKGCAKTMTEAATEQRRKAALASLEARKLRKLHDKGLHIL